MLFLSIFNMLDFIFFPTFSLPDFGWWMLYLIYLLVYSILNVFIQLKWLTVIYDWLYDKFEKYGKRLGLLKEYSSIYSRY